MAARIVVAGATQRGVKITVSPHSKQREFPQLYGCPTYSTHTCMHTITIRDLQNAFLPRALPLMMVGARIERFASSITAAASRWSTLARTALSQCFSPAVPLVTGVCGHSLMA